MSQENDDSTFKMKVQNDLPKYCLYSKKVWIQEKSDFVEAYIFINGEFIQDILFPCATQQQCLEEYQREYPLIYDYGELFIFPGLIDINVSLQIGSDWEEIEQTTELYMKGGVTTIACQPLITNEKYLRDELSSIRYKKERMINKSSVDFCFLANLYPDNVSQLEEIYREPGVAGFKNGAGWVETKKDIDIIMKKINDFRLILQNEENHANQSEKVSSKQSSQKCILLTFHSIKSGDKELTITSPLRQRKIQERCDKTTQIKRTEGDSVLGETHKTQKNLEINYDCDDQFDNLTMGQISEGINDNILNLNQVDIDTSDDEINNQSENQESEEKIAQTPFKENNSQFNNQPVEQPHVSSQSNREKYIKMFAKATINSTENLQIKLIARAEMQTYSSRDNNGNQSENEQESSISSNSQDSENSDDANNKDDENKTLNSQEKSNINRVHKNIKLDKSTSICSPISSPSSNRFEASSPRSEAYGKDYRKESQESSDDLRLLENQHFPLIPFPTYNQTTYAYDTDGENSTKSQGKFIKVQKVQQETNCNSSLIKDEDKTASLQKIDENADSAKDSNSDQDEDNNTNYNNANKQYHKKSYNEQSDRKGSGNFLLNYKLSNIQSFNAKRGSHDIPKIIYSENDSHIKLIKDMKRGSCDKDSPSHLNDHPQNFKKSSFNLQEPKQQVSSMQDINKKSGQNLIPPNASKMRFSEKRKSFNLNVQVENNRYSRSESVNIWNGQNLNEQEDNDVKFQTNLISYKSQGLIEEKSSNFNNSFIQKSEFYSNNCINNEQQKQQENQDSKDCLSPNSQVQLNQNDDQNDNQNDSNIGENKMQNTNIESTNSLGNHINNQSQSSIGENNQNNQKFQNTKQVSCKYCNQTCKCNSNQNNQQNKSKFSQDYLTFLAFRPPYWEYFGIQMIKESFEKNQVSSKVKLKIVFANIGNSNSMYRITTLKEDLKKKTADIHLYSETAGAFLFFSSNKITNGQTIFKCEPPIGVRENKEFLINASKLNMVDVISSYHFPVDEAYKCIEEGDFRKAFSGICTAGFTLQATWTALYQSYKNSKNNSLTIKRDESTDIQKKQILLKYLVNMLSTKPSKILNIHHMKGSITKGKYADFVVWDPFSSCQRIKIPPTYRFKTVHIFDKKKVYGLVHCTILRGKVVYDNHTNSPAVFSGNGKLICKNEVI